MSTQIIPPNILEPGQIANILEAYIASKPEASGWKDTYAGSSGQTLIELVAALGGFDAYQRIALRQELSIDNAVTPTAIREHCFNKGILTPPTSSLVLKLELTVESDRFYVTEGELVGTIGDYELYSLENKSTTDSSVSLQVVAGFLVEDIKTVTPTKMSTHKILTDYEFIGTQLERFKANDTVIPLVSELNYSQKYSNSFLLRRAIPGEVRIYIGNGVLGWFDSEVSTYSYKYIGYNQDITGVVNLSPSLLKDDVTIESYTALQQPVFGIDADELRIIQAYYPLDGRISQDGDYEGLILNHFGGILHDVYSYNTDPDQIINLLIDDNFDIETHLPEIYALINERRQNGINVNYVTFNKSQGVVINLTFKVNSEDYSNYYLIRQDIEEYLWEKTRKFQREPTNISVSDLAVELTDKFNIKFYSVNNVTYELDSIDFIQTFNIEFISA